MFVMPHRLWQNGELTPSPLDIDLERDKESLAMLLQTNSYIVPADKRTEHQRLIRRFRQVMAKLGCDMFDVYEQVGPNWGGGETTGRFVQIMRFRDHQHQRAVQSAERSDATAQALIAEFCELINLQYQQQQGLFAVGFYRSVGRASEESAAGAQQPVVTEEPGAGEHVDQGEQQYGVDQGGENDQFASQPEEVVAQQMAEATPQVEQAAGPQWTEEPEPQAQGAGASGDDGHGSGERAIFQDEGEVEVEVEGEPEDEHAGAVPPLALDDLDLEALAQEELSQAQNARDKDRTRRRG